MYFVFLNTKFMMMEMFKTYFILNARRKGSLMYSFALYLFSEPMSCELKGGDELMETTARRHVEIYSISQP